MSSSAVGLADGGGGDEGGIEGVGRGGWEDVWGHEGGLRDGALGLGVEEWWSWWGSVGCVNKQREGSCRDGGCTWGFVNTGNCMLKFCLSVSPSLFSFLLSLTVIHSTLRPLNLLTAAGQRNNPLNDLHIPNERRDFHSMVDRGCQGN